MLFELIFCLLLLLLVALSHLSILYNSDSLILLTPTFHATSPAGGP